MRGSPFSCSVKGLLRSAAEDPWRKSSWTSAEKDLHAKYLDMRGEVDRALRDSVDTTTVVKTLLELVRTVNVYIRTEGADQARTNLLADCARYVSWMLKVLGVGGMDDEIGLGSLEAAGSGGSLEQLLGPHLDAWTKFRDEIRQLARENASAADILKACDRVRDEVLPEVGVRIDDSGSGGGVWKLYDAAELRKLMTREEEERQARELEKQQRAEELARKNRERDRQASIPPAEMFQTGAYEGLYSTYDEEGIPLLDKDGVELTKNARKKLKKAHQQQTTAHEAWLRRQ